MADSLSSSSDAVSSEVNPDNPWPGLYSYTEDLAAFFHGREAECDELLRRVRQKSLTVLFGQSGLGKSSLIRAGLIPRLKEEGFRPIIVRFTFGRKAIDSVSAVERLDIVEQCRRQFAAGLPAAHFAGENGPGAPSACESAPPPAADSPRRDETLREYFRRAAEFTDESGRPFIPVLIFDQFEEVFTRGSETAEGREEAGAFLRELADLVEDPAASAPRFRVLIALREDYLACLESWRGELPSLVENRMRLTPLDGQGALRAVTRPAALREGRDPLASPAVSRQIVRYLAGGGARDGVGETAAAWEDFARFEVDPALLSLVLRELNDRRRDRGLSRITPELLRETGEVAGILGAFYDRTVADQHPAVRVLVEDQLLTDTGYRDNVSVERAQSFLHEEGAGADAVERLVERRLLRVEERLEQRRLELAHDVLCPVLAERRAKRREEDEKRAAEEAARQAEARAAAAEAEREREVRARAEAERLRQNADSAGHRARRFAVVAGIVAILALAALLFALQAQRETEREKAWALKEQARAEAGEAQARVAEEAALKARKTADELGGRAVAGETQAKSAQGKALVAKKAADELLKYMQYDLSNTLQKTGQLTLMETINGKIRKYQEENPPEHGDLDALREYSVTLGERGDLLMDQGKLDEAAKVLQQSLTIRESLAKQDPARAQWQSDLRKGYDRIGRVQQAQGEPAEALGAYRQELAIAERLAKKEPGNVAWQGDLFWSDISVGSALSSQGQFADALKANGEAQEIAKHLVKQDPGDTDWQRNLSIAYETTGSVLAAQQQLTGALKAYRDCISVRERLAKQDPGNATWQRDLEVSYEDLGGALNSQGQLADALKAFRDGGAISERLAKEDPHNAAWQRDLARNYGEIGDAAQRQKLWSDAVEAFGREAEIARPWLGRANTDATWMSHFSYSAGSRWEVLRDAPLGTVKLDRAAVLADVRASRDAMKQLEKAGHLAPQTERSLSWIERLLSAEEAREKAEKAGAKP